MLNTEDVLNYDSDAGDIKQNFSNTCDSIQDDSGSGTDNTIPVRSRKQTTLWQAKNNFHKIIRHIYSDTDGGVQPETELSSDSQPVEIFLKFVSDRTVNLTACHAFFHKMHITKLLLFHSKIPLFH
jgi:hypothetical protein